MSVTIKYKGNTIASITTDSSRTLKTSGKYCEGDIVVDNVQDGGITPSGNKAITATTSTQTGIDVTNYATVSVAPTPSETKSVTTNGDVTPSSGKLLSKVTVNVPTGTARDSSDLTVSGATVNVPAGLYSSAASKSVASGTAGTPTASKGAVSNNSVTVTPSVTNTEGYITGGTKTGTGVTVSASELVSGNKALTPSTTAQANIDVKNYATASVAAITKELLASLDTDFVAENIKKDVDLFGLVGTMEAGGEYIIKHGSRTFTENTFPYTAPVVIEHGLGQYPLFFIGVSGTAGSFHGGAIAYIIATSNEIRPKRVNENFYCAASTAGTDHMQIVYDNGGYGRVTMNETSVTINSNYSGHGFYVSGSHPAILNWWVVARK